MLEEAIRELTEDLKLAEERERHIKAQHTKLIIILLATSLAQGTLTALIPNLKLTLTTTLGAAPKQDLITPLLFATSLTATSYIITRTTNLNHKKIPLYTLALFLTSFYITSTITNTATIQTILNTITWIKQLT